MLEEFHIEPTPEGMIPSSKHDNERQADLYRVFFDSKELELNFLQRLQTNGELYGIKWSPDHFARLKELQGIKKQGLSEEQKLRLAELTRIQNKGGEEWTPELQKELVELYRLENSAK